MKNWTNLFEHLSYLALSMMFDLRGGRFAGSEGGLAIGEHSEEKLDDALDDIEFVRFLGSKKVHNRKDNIPYYTFYYPNVADVAIVNNHKSRFIMVNIEVLLENM